MGHKRIIFLSLAAIGFLLFYSLLSGETSAVSAQAL